MNYVQGFESREMYVPMRPGNLLLTLANGKLSMKSISPGRTLSAAVHRKLTLLLVVLVCHYIRPEALLFDLQRWRRAGGKR